MSSPPRRLTAGGAQTAEQQAMAALFGALAPPASDDGLAEQIWRRLVAGRPEPRWRGLLLGALLGASLASAILIVGFDLMRRPPPLPLPRTALP